jgi:thiol-disulfide isomerase/thioredoxin
MSNPLTGDCEAVVQIATRQLNGLLGALHQNADQDAPLKLLHSTSARIGDPPRREPEVGPFGEWVIAQQRAGSGLGLDDLRSQLTATAPPGTAKLLSEAFDEFDNWEVELPDDPDVVRGLVRLQVSNVTISVPNGSSSEATIHASIRARYYPDPGTTALPASVHGRVHTTFDVTNVPGSQGSRLFIEPSAQDTKIQFVAAPGSGLTAVDESRIAVQVRKFIRDLTLLPVDLPQDFAFASFKGIGSGSNQVIALPFQLSGGAPPPNGMQGVTQSFIGSSGFGVAINKAHVTSLIDLDAIRQSVAAVHPSFTIDYGLGSATVKYDLSFSDGDPFLTLTNGGIQISGRVDARTSTSWAPNGWVEFTQLITLDVDPQTQAISVRRAGDPDVDESWFIPHERAVNIVRREVDEALARNGTAIRRVFHDARSDLRNGLREFDPGAIVSFTSIQITGNGVIVGGEISSLSPRRAPVIEVAETHEGAAFTAFRSWIPAGRIDRFVWSWVEYPHTGSILHGVEKTSVQEHDFILDKPAGVKNVGRVCLRLEGTMIAAAGQELPVAGGTTCRVQEPEVAMDIPSWWGPLTIPFFTPGLVETGTLRQAIAGHVGVQSPAGSGLAQRNALVYFADGRENSLGPLVEALSRTKSASSVTTVVVLPAGAFDASRREVEDRLGLSPESSGPLQLTEDDEGGWTRTFGVTTTPSMYLLNARREFVWKHEGEPDPATVAAALDEFAVPTVPSGFSPIRLAVSPGEAAPDAAFVDSGRGYALHRLRGGIVLLNFWQSWSAPCLAELQRLQGLHDECRPSPFIVAFHGGADAKQVDVVRKRLGLAYPVVQDSRQQIGLRYGVRCWPTTIKIGADGRVDHIQLGTAHEHEPSGVGAVSAASE